ncbi:hypothetical protein QJR26_06850 [Clostridium baratii]|uniref:hypothetical protein n=1 Tax=Clostridium baratii TaxID=1561 RepID=UPI000A7B95CA|nr:hypothetical protein [Clostridium baratii]
MNIGLIDADLLDNGTRHPNLALMKISGFKKEQGHSVELLESYDDIEKYDEVYISKVFSYTRVPKEINKHKNVNIGGTGFFEDGGESLPDEIEHHMPDYNLYSAFVQKKIDKGESKIKYKDYLEYSIGFSTRGCFRKCPFCVNKKYDKVVRHAPISEFVDPNRKKIYLWDDNFLAFSNWEEVLDELEATGKPFQFRQGLDIRLMTDRKAERFSKVKYNGDFIFAFDNLKDKEQVVRGLRIWKRYSKKTTKLYVLSGYESQDEKDIENIFERIKILMEFQCIPYIMRYEEYKNSEYRGMYINLARWCNQPSFFKKKSFREFCEANQEKVTTGRICATLRYMQEFEEKHPDIAKKYFDLKYLNYNVEDVLEEEIQEKEIILSNIKIKK